MKFTQNRLVHLGKSRCALQYGGPCAPENRREFGPMDRAEIDTHVA